MALMFQRLGFHILRTNFKSTFQTTRTAQSLVSHSEVPCLPVIFDPSQKQVKVNNKNQNSSDSVALFFWCSDNVTSCDKNKYSVGEKEQNHFDWRKDLLIINSDLSTLCILPRLKRSLEITYESGQNNDHASSEFLSICSNSSAGKSLEFLQNDISREISSTLESINLPQEELEFLKSSISWYSSQPIPSSPDKTDLKTPDDKSLGKPSMEQLNAVKERLAETLPHFFNKVMDYSIYDPKVVFVNNIWNRKTSGIGMYSLNLSVIRILAYFKYTQITVQLLKITVHPEDGAVKVRWRVAGLSNTASLKFWNFYPGKYRENVEKDSQWTDGLSTYYINKHGMVYKHVVDNVIPDNEIPNVVPVAPVA
ncbi:uncharacterized protein [Mytilus edulis]|uniref:uncharacterized protein n=1 Tax=Mytilus edulis TaxID=6550 RepID=UPI0039EEFC75